MKKSILIVILLVFMSLIFYGCVDRDSYISGDDYKSRVDSQRDKAYVEIRDSKFVPQELKVREGTIVVWVNNDNVTHTVTSTTGRANLGEVEPGSAISYIFNEDGEFHYYCLMNKSMRGEIIVGERRSGEEE